MGLQYTNISISGDRIAVILPNGYTAQFTAWDLEEYQHKDIKNQMKAAFALCSTFDDVVKHLRINGYDAGLEDIYES